MRGSCFELYTSGERGARGLRQAIGVRSIEARFAVVAHAEKMIGVVDAVIRLKADDHHAGTAGNVAIVGHVEQHFVEDLLLNPFMKDGNERIEVHMRGIFEHKLYVDVLECHVGLAFRFYSSP